MNAPFHDEPYNGQVSKTRRKKEVNTLQKLGKELTALPYDTLYQMMLPTDLLTAILDYKRFHTHGAKKRQEQYIGRLMRHIDPQPISHQLASVNATSVEYKAWLHRVEHWRQRLLDDDSTLETLLRTFSVDDAQQLRTLIRNARKEQQYQKSPKSFRQLFQYLKEIIPFPTLPSSVDG